MPESANPRSERRWPRGQRFRLSERGGEAEAACRMAVQEVRGTGRESLEAAQRRWAEPLGLEPCDGLILAELRAGPRSLPQLVRAADACGTTDAEVRGSLERLVGAGLVELLPAVRQAA